MIDFANHAVVTLPFGRHKDRPLTAVPAEYLAWLLREIWLSTGLRTAVAGELARRGLPVQPPAPPRPLRTCPHHPGERPVCLWMEDTLGRRRLTAQCPSCLRSGAPFNIRLRRWLKVGLRCFGLRCTSIRNVPVVDMADRPPPSPKRSCEP
jgi:hypothetical protein